MAVQLSKDKQCDNREQFSNKCECVINELSVLLMNVNSAFEMQLRPEGVPKFLIYDVHQRG